MQPSTFLLPLSKEELIALSAIIAASLLAIDATNEDDASKAFLMMQKPYLESVQNKIKLRR